MKKIVLLFVSVLMIFSIILQVSAQDDKSLTKKLKELKGEILSITIKTSDDQITIEDEDAEKLFKKIKMLNNDFDYEIITLADKEGERNTFKVKLEGVEKEDSNKVMVFVTSDSDFEWSGNLSNFDGEVVNENIEIEITDSKKIVTITTEENGEKSVKIYEGKEAEEFLEKYESDEMEFKVKDGKKIIIKKKSEKDKKD
ncbi:MAG: hypothetical protein K8F60_17870 [Melioribacteraceae bacterium]|nr:hypothetical protein [Melioribacteraceae bacterium]